MTSISIVIPAFNEADNLPLLLQRIHRALQPHHFQYEVIVVDDRSTDSTPQTVKALQKKYPALYQLKQGEPGKAYSLLEGFRRARFPYLAMIDGDQQYPPEALPSMIDLLQSDQADIVVANRKEERASLVRFFGSRVFMYIFGQLLHGLHYDVQSGLKAFRKEIIDRLSLNPTPWTFDLEFLLQARAAGYRISSIDIVYSPRYAGQSKVKFIQAAWEISLQALKAKVAFHPPTASSYRKPSPDAVIHRSKGPIPAER